MAVTKVRRRGGATSDPARIGNPAPEPEFKAGPAAPANPVSPAPANPVSAAPANPVSATPAESTSTGKTGKIIIALLLGFIVLYVLVYVYKMYTKSSLQTTTLLKKPISVPFAEVDITRDVQLPRNIVGNQYSLSFWVYIDGIPPTTKPKFILSRGPVEVTLSSDNHLVVDMGKKMVYKNFPTNRWVNVVLVVDETLATLYIDGKFTEAERGNYKAITGNVIIGKPDYRERLDGYLSKVQIFNYALTIDHTQIIYKAGPLHKSILGMIGIPMYGLRSPFVRLDEVSVEDK